VEPRGREAAVERPPRRGRISLAAHRLDGLGPVECLERGPGKTIKTDAALVHRMDDARRALPGELERSGGEISGVGRVDLLVRDDAQRLARARSLQDPHGRTLRTT